MAEGPRGTRADDDTRCVQDGHTVPARGFLPEDDADVLVLAADQLVAGAGARESDGQGEREGGKGSAGEMQEAYLVSSSLLAVVGPLS